MADFPREGQAQWQDQGLRDGPDVKNYLPSNGLNVHARAAPEKHNAFVKGSEVSIRLFLPFHVCFSVEISSS